MSAWLDDLRRALDGATRPVAFFFRDDDAGWADRQLCALLDLFAHRALPVDVAAIPCALTPTLAAELRTRIAAAPDTLAVHQHGFAHFNHEPEGRKCEFGDARSHVLQRRDIELGRRLLRDLHGLPVGRIFTPPWNRCSGVTGECLRRAGFRVLSRDVTAQPLNIAGLHELPVTVDWFARRKGVRLERGALGTLLANAVAKSASPVGIMFHHALMDAEEFRCAGELCALLAAQTNARCCLMRELTGATPNVAAHTAVTVKRPAAAETCHYEGVNYA
jgi:predicted deacetylase